FNFLGIKTAAIISGKSLLYDPEYTDESGFDPRLIHLKPITRKEAYLADVTYGINSEFGFDYLRDNMANMPDQINQRGFHYAIVDEADSVLIDEARTPHIISAPYDQDTSKYYTYAKYVKNLTKDDYLIDEKLKTAHLTEKGIEHIEKMLGVSNVYEQDYETLFHIEAALKANTLFKKDKDYIVRDNEVVIVDEFTGRLLEGRRFSEGLHQAIEAKENVSIKQESRTLATVSLQNYFRGYKKLAGMTGTAATEAEEFNKIYKTDVFVVPTNRPNIRKDQADLIYKTEKAKNEAVVAAIAEQYKKGRPVLVGTTSIDKNEHLSKLLKQKGISHELLNAKNHEREAQIIAQAGKKYAVTVATNMAGRGVDIVLGGEVQRELFKTDAQFEKAQQNWQKEHDDILELGGLYVIGTERHESRRIDNQLRGRAGRQGDAGETQFFVSLEDDVMRIFGGEQISNLMTMLKFPEDQPLSHPMVSRAIEQAQIKVEGFNFDIRKHLVEYDDVLNRQRDILYSLRRKMLLLPEQDPDAFYDTFFRMVEEHVQKMTTSFFALRETDPEMHDQFENDVELLLDIQVRKLGTMIEDQDQEQAISAIMKAAEKKFADQEERLGKEVWYQIVRSLFLSTFDQYWTQHLSAIDDLREGINLRAHANMDPLVEYKNEAFSMFEQLIGSIQYESIRRIMRVQVEKHEDHFHTNQPPQQEMVLQSASRINPFKKEDVGIKPEKQAEPVTQSVNLQKEPAKKKKIGRNDPCWCGSGKKYKKCHLNRDPQS
ncbi:MAG TPA: preprotein translocase subunit SecA, partial [Candidatus Woesebacteria bacterium]|nr:preprotein translocase subunit SecA [Candidatus Woesebacteria bacterium]